MKVQEQGLVVTVLVADLGNPRRRGIFARDPVRGVSSDDTEDKKRNEHHADRDRDYGEQSAYDIGGHRVNAEAPCRTWRSDRETHVACSFGTKVGTGRSPVDTPTKPTRNP